MSRPEPLTHSTSCVSPARSSISRLERGVAAAVQHQRRLAARAAASCRRAAPAPRPRPARRRPRSPGARRHLSSGSASPPRAKWGQTPRLGVVHFAIGVARGLTPSHLKAISFRCRRREGSDPAAPDRAKRGPPRGGAHAALGDEPGDQPRRRHVEGVVARRAAGRGDLDRHHLAVPGAPAHDQHLVGAALLDRDVAAVAERPVDGRVRQAT